MRRVPYLQRRTGANADRESSRSAAQEQSSWDAHARERSCSEFANLSSGSILHPPIQSGNALDTPFILDTASDHRGNSGRDGDSGADHALAAYLQRAPARIAARTIIPGCGFFTALLTVRGITVAIHYNFGPFHDVSMGGRHIHHLVWGILLLLLSGYGWLLQVGTDR